MFSGGGFKMGCGKCTTDKKKDAKVEKKK